jgi:uracil-DNA glycosylase family 4
MSQKDNLEIISTEVIVCRRCPRLVAWREQLGRDRKKSYRDQEYWSKPVPGLGDPKATVMILGLAPGAHGSNRTGQMFTGDDSGRFLFLALYKAGFANQPTAIARDDGLKITGLWITAVCRCVPPDNKPLPSEIANCREYVTREMKCLSDLAGIVTLGKIAFDSALKLTGRKPVKFRHGVFCPPIGSQPWILASFHPSRQNTQTGRLSIAMFDEIWSNVKRLQIIN